MTDLNDDLLEHLYWTMTHGFIPRCPMERMAWVMSEEWLNEALSLCSKDGRPLVFLDNPAKFKVESLQLYGVNVVVRENGGPPHLEDIGV